LPLCFLPLRHQSVCPGYLTEILNASVVSENVIKKAPAMWLAKGSQPPELKNTLFSFCPGSAFCGWRLQFPPIQYRAKTIVAGSGISGGGTQPVQLATSLPPPAFTSVSSAEPEETD
jgi:hypothetical protein